MTEKIVPVYKKFQSKTWFSIRLQISSRTMNYFSQLYSIHNHDVNVMEYFRKYTRIYFNVTAKKKRVYRHTLNAVNVRDTWDNIKYEIIKENPREFYLHIKSGD